MSEFNKEAHISARVHIADKNKLKKSGYNARQAIEYFNSISNNKLDALKIEEYFLNKEIEDMKEHLILKERKLNKLQQAIDELHIDKLSSLRTDSYAKIVGVYNRDRTNQSFEEFVNGRYIQEKFIEPEADKFPECSFEDFVFELVDYYKNVILLSNTF